MNLAESWSRVAHEYEAEFVDPFRPDVENPLLAELTRIEDAAALTVGDLGCGAGPLLPILAARFHTVHAVDFAEGMLQRAKERCRELRNVELHLRSFTDLEPLAGRLDVALAVNSLVLPDVRELDEALRQIRRCLRTHGRFLGIVPAMDGVHYYTMLLLDRALRQGKPLEAARKNAAHFGDHQYFDFAFGQFRYKGIEQHFWQPFEIPWRLERAGFREVRLSKVHLSWEQFAFAADFPNTPAPWDWCFSCWAG
jgi:SAM-dependent methyltransferase